MCLSQLASALLINFKIMHHRTSIAQHVLHTHPVAPSAKEESKKEAPAKEEPKKEAQYWSF
jgi:hypothetical protein